MVLSTLGFLLTLTSIVGVLLAAFFFIIGKRPKASRTFKLSLLLFATGFVLVLAGTITDANKGSPTKAQIQLEQPEEHDPVVQYQNGRKEDKPELVPPTIPGLAWVDLTLNLEKKPYDFHFDRRKSRLTPTYERSARKIDPDTGVEMFIQLLSYGDKVVVYEASVAGSRAYPVASWLIPYLATAPFEGNPQNDSKRWALDALEKVRQGEPVTRRVGNVLMEIIGNPPNFYALQVKHMDWESYLTKITY